MSYHDVLDKVLDINNFTVGGGASSALAGAMAAGMIGMVAKLSMKKDHGLSKEACEKVAVECESLKELLTKGAVDDETAFCGLRDAYRMPKETDMQKQLRKDKIQSAAIQAADIPKQNACNCKDVVKLGESLIGCSNPNAASDLMIAIDFARLGVRGCVLNIEANLPIIKDTKVQEAFNDAIAELSEVK